MTAAKRKAATTAASQRPAKKGKQPSMLKGVTEALDISQVPDRCRSMLHLMAEHSLVLASDERHEIDRVAVELLSSELEKLRSDYVSKRDALMAECEATSEILATHDEKMPELQESVTATKSKAHTSKFSLAETMEAFLAAKEEAKQAQEKELAKDIEAKNLNAQMETLNAGFQSFTSLKDGGSLDDHAVAVKSVQAVVSMLEVDDSLVVALPTCLSKAVQERGAFDAKVIQTLEESILKKKEEMQEQLDRCSTEVAELKEEQTRCIEASKEHSEKLKLAAKTFKEDDGARQQEQERMESAEVARKAVMVQLEEQRAKGKDASETLQSFQDYNLECFSLLRDRVTKAPKADAASTSVAPADAANDEEAAAPPAGMSLDGENAPEQGAGVADSGEAGEA